MSCNESHSEMFLGYGGCRAPEAPILIEMPGLFAQEAVSRRGRHMSGQLGFADNFARSLLVSRSING